MVRVILCLAALAVVSGCALAPDQAEPGWADALLAQTPPGETPHTVNTETLDADLRQTLLTSAVIVQRQGQGVRRTGLVLRAPTLDTAEFVVEARERARPPAPQ